MQPRGRGTGSGTPKKAEDEEYLRLLEERNRILQRVQSKRAVAVVARAASAGAREKEFSVYFSGANEAKLKRGTQQKAGAAAAAPSGPGIGLGMQRSPPQSGVRRWGAFGDDVDPDIVIPEDIGSEEELPASAPQRSESPPPPAGVSFVHFRIQRIRDRVCVGLAEPPTGESEAVSVALARRLDKMSARKQQYVSACLMPCSRC
jgi:hypothetical protein